ncbi:MOSC domain-containing protein [Nocardioides piscis]|uniref:MOSC domain-containing protein n=1 Tax=Nocardioides piscis TaxID=2714938 RepID=A0A6G7YCX2_9ACTN|nr:MOSC N-terminal beta barrel domain-containing protein [Nocardioides piscis]QIK74620.1 MOSC domain-containing protein [Nocardioides piscis]
MQVTRLTTYPVKSMGSEDVPSAQVAPEGLVGDRRWVVLDPDGNRVSATHCHQLLGFLATHYPAGLQISARDGATVRVETPGSDARRISTGMSRVDQLSAADDDASAWLSERLGRPVVLAYQGDGDVREIGESHGGRPGERMRLADAGPILLVTEASLARLGDWVAETQQQEWLDPGEAARRFRPNVVVDGGEPFAEDDWFRVRIGDVTFRRGELCDRCVITTIDLDTLETTHEPIRTLARHRKWDGYTWFGVRLIPEFEKDAGTSRITVGDPVEVLQTRPLGVSA